MKTFATILVSGTLLMVPGLALAQSAASGAGDKPPRSQTVRIPHDAASASPRGPDDTDRAIDAETRRIDRMMTICNRC